MSALDDQRVRRPHIPCHRPIPNSRRMLFRCLDMTGTDNLQDRLEFRLYRETSLDFLEIEHDGHALSSSAYRW